MRNLEIKLDIKANKDSFINAWKNYNFILPNKAHPTFTNKKDAAKFVKDTEKMFEQILFQLNEIYTGLYVDYRSHLFYLSLEQEINFETYFKEMNIAMYNAWYRSSLGSNGVAYLFNNVNLSLNSAENIIKKMDKFYRKIKIYDRLIHNSNIKEQLEAIKLKLNKWGWKHHNPVFTFKNMGISKYEHDYFKSHALY